MVEQYGIKAYIGVPIHHQGAVIGSLCALDNQPRQWPASLPRELKAIAKELEERLDTLRERSDDEEVVAVSDKTLHLMMSTLVQESKELEKSFVRLNERLRSEKWRELSQADSEGEKRENANEVAEIYRAIEDAVVGMRRNALRIADAFELRKGKVDAKTLTALRQDARAVGRAFGEMGPMIRLVESQAMGVISEADFAKNAQVLGEADASADDALQSLRRLAATGQKLIEAHGK